MMQSPKSTNSNAFGDFPTFPEVFKEQNDTAFPVAPSPSPKRSKRSPPKSPSKPSKSETEMKVLTSMVQALALKLKKRDREVQTLQEKADKFTEVSLQLEHAEDRLVNVSAENTSLSRRCRSLQTTLSMQDKAVDATVNNRWDAKEEGPATVKTIAEEDELHQLRLERDTAMVQAGELSMALAESRAESDELGDQLAAVMELFKKQDTKFSPPLTPVGSLRNLMPWSP
jgi:chromosome segregation ATPase